MRISGFVAEIGNVSGSIACISLGRNVCKLDSDIVVTELWRSGKVASHSLSESVMVGEWARG